MASYLRKVHFHFSQFIQRVVQAGFYGADRATQHRGDILQRSILEKTELNHIAVFFRKHFEATRQLKRGFVFSRSGCCRGWRRRGIFFVFFAQSLDLLGRQPRRRKRTRTCASGRLLMAMQEDGIEPGGKAAGFIVTRQTLPRAHLSLRYDILRRGLVISQNDCLLKQSSLQRFNQSRKRFAIPGASAQKKFPFDGRFRRVVCNDHLSIDCLTRCKGSKKFGEIEIMPGSNPRRLGLFLRNR